MTNYSNLSNQELFKAYQQAKVNFKNSPEGSQEEIEADKVFTELSKEIESREDFNFIQYKIAEQEQRKELLQALINQIESLEDGGVINLISFIEDENIKPTDELLMYLYNNIKHLNIRVKGTVNNIPQSIKVFAKYV